VKSTAISIFAAAAIASTSVLSSTALAQSTEPSRTADSVRIDFVQAGFHASAPTTWWLAGVTTFTAADAIHHRVTMVLVYPSLEAANAQRNHAAAVDSSAPREHPRLVPGYGPSEWRGNVALVQSTPADLVRLYVAQHDDGAMVIVRTGDNTADELAAPSLLSGQTVDADFIAILTPAVTVDL
jgi:hypothetical protein